MKSMFYLIKKILSFLNDYPDGMFITNFHEHINESKSVKRCLTTLLRMDFIEIDSTFIRLTKGGRSFIKDINRFDDSEIDKAIEDLSVHYLTNKLDDIFNKML